MSARILLAIAEETLPAGAATALSREGYEPVSYTHLTLPTN